MKEGQKTNLHRHLRVHQPAIDFGLAVINHVTNDGRSEVNSKCASLVLINGALGLCSSYASSPAGSGLALRSAVLKA